MSTSITFTAPAGVAKLSRAGERRAATRQQIVGAVRELLGEGASFSELSVGRIAERAGVSRATFYLHFEDKRQLLGDLASQELSEWQTIAAPLLANAEAGRSDVENAVRQVVELWRTDRPVIAALIELAEYDDDARATWRGVIESVAASIAEYVKQRPDFEVDDPEMTALAISWMTERACHQVLDGASPDEQERLVQVITDLIWRGRRD